MKKNNEEEWTVKKENEEEWRTKNGNRRSAMKRKEITHKEWSNRMITFKS